MVTQRSVFFPVCKQMAHFWLCKKKKEKEEEKKKQFMQQFGLEWNTKYIYGQFPETELSHLVLLFVVFGQVNAFNSHEFEDIQKAVFEPSRW